jgi:hypothetical protein
MAMMGEALGNPLFTSHPKSNFVRIAISDRNLGPQTHSVLMPSVHGECLLLLLLLGEQGLAMWFFA